MIQVVIADDHAVVRAGLRAVLEGNKDIRVAAEAGDFTSTLAAVKDLHPDVLLTDLSMPGGHSSDLIKRVRREAPSTRVLVLTMHATTLHVREACLAGAHGYVVKGSGLDDLVEALHRVARGECFFDATATRLRECDSGKTGAPEHLAILTPRELEVLRLIALGNTNRETARILGISPKTVDVHRTNLIQKLNLHTPQELTRYAIRRGLITDE
jgi:DNA-binding NarL/FixJ family response regulator